MRELGLAALGSVGFGGAAIAGLYTLVDDATAAAAVEAAWEAGVRYFDTAPHYGLGLSERRLGAALRHYPRNEFVVSTKVGRLLERNPHPTGRDPDGFEVPDDLTRRLDYTADGVRRSISDSLERMGLDRIDIALVHDPDEHMDIAMAEAVPALAELRDHGVVGAVGAGMNHVAPLQRLAAHRHVEVVMVAGRWTPVDRRAAPLLAACAANGVSVLAAAPFNSGLLATDWPADDACFDYGPASAAVLATARRIATLCREYDVALPAVAVQFARRHPAVATVVAGMRTAEQSRTAVRWAATPVPAELWAAIDAEVAPGYGPGTPR